MAMSSNRLVGKGEGRKVGVGEGGSGGGREAPGARAAGLFVIGPVLLLLLLMMMTTMCLRRVWAAAVLRQRVVSQAV